MPGDLIELLIASAAKRTCVRVAAIGHLRSTCIELFPDDRPGWCIPCLAKTILAERPAPSVGPAMVGAAAAVEASAETPSWIETAPDGAGVVATIGKDDAAHAHRGYPNCSVCGQDIETALAAAGGVA